MILSMSVAICTFNGEKYIKEQLESIINQSVQVNEIILCDDCSTDRTVKIAKEVLLKSGINHKIIINENNLGFLRNFEKCISYCSSDIIFLSDQDDVWLSTKVEKIINIFKTIDNINLVFTNAFIVDEDLRVQSKSLWKFFKFSNNDFDISKFTVNLIKKNVVTGATLALRKELLLSALPFPENWVHDHWLALTSSLNNSIFPLNEKLIYYRQHSNNVYGAKKKSIYKRIRNYFKNLKQQHLYINRLNALKSLRDHIISRGILKNDVLSSIESELSFWNEYSLFQHSLIRIIKNTYNLNYFKYYSGFRSIIRDLLLCHIK